MAKLLKFPIGTHSLIQKGVEFSKLALVILDEQHRFGVEQRDHLIKNKKLVPHLLSMTATPIPRTLALTAYGDLDLSLIDEMPKNRKKVKTIIVEPQQRKEAYEFIKKEVAGGKGVFVIYPKIDSQATKLKEAIEKHGPVSGSFVPQNYAPMSLASLAINEVKALKEEYEKLSKEVFPDLRITMLHGKMKPPEKERIMLDFKKGEIDILLSTSVVEVGVDVPRATIMMIEGAERFGLSQLHQFRGRVGRSDMQSYCFLFTTDPSMLNRKRLKALVESSNGFELAEKDLEIRGPGSLYGTVQSGIPDMAMQGLSNIFLVEKTRAAAKEILEKDPELKSYPELKDRLKKFQSRIHFE
jgi:ATP-dependent DNA helicase RecG